jgi:hypothetical protein
MIQAKRHRDSEILRLRANPQAAEELDIEEHNKLPPASFQHLPSSVRSTLARDRWRKLVGTNGQDGFTPHRSTLRNIAVPEKTLETFNGAPPKGAEVQFNDLDCAMNEPYFSPQDLFPLAFGGDASEFASQAILNGDNMTALGYKSEQPGVPIENFSTRGSNALPIQGTAGGRTDPAVAGGQLPNAMTDDNPPPWLWNVQSLHNFTDYNGVAMGDDQDVSMDTDGVVNWQNWMDSGLGINGVGFTGGI